LELKRKIIEDFTKEGLYPYTRYYLREIQKAVGFYWANHFSTIGLIGMNEACVNMFGKGILTPEGKEWALKILEFMREKISEFQEETGNLYNLEASPAESASYRLARADKERFPDIYTKGKTYPYYTNSVHPPVDEVEDAFNLLEHQDPLQVLFTGGTVVHIFLGESIEDWCMVRDLTRKIVERFSLPYFSFTPTFSICPVHGYIKGEHFYCPYPHTEEELEEFGEAAELNRKQLTKMQKGSYKKLEEEKNEKDKKEMRVFLNKTK
jgi:ribonucleoside-triphosphate reductase